MNILKSQKSEIILTIIINFLLDLIPLYLAIWNGQNDEIPLPIFFISFAIVGLRISVLPIYYNWLEKRTQNEAIRNFIKELRYNRKIRLVMLIPLSYTITCLNFSLIALNFKFGISFAFYLISLFFGSAGNYLALFAYWFIVDLYKKIRQNH